MPLTLLFDLDGTLVDTDPVHFQAYTILLDEQRRPPIDFDFYTARIMGFGHLEIFSMLFPERDRAAHQILADRKEELFRDLVRELEPRPGLLELLDWAAEQRWRCGVVTNAPRENAMMMLGGLHLADRFETIVFGEELAHGKPHPLPYVTGLELLEGRVGEALAFEDSLSGVRSASGAGIHTFGVLSALPAQALREAGASGVIEDFRDPGLWAEIRRHTTGAPSYATSQ